MKIKVGTYENNFTDLVVMVWLTLNQPCEISRASGMVVYVRRISQRMVIPWMSRWCG